MKKEDAKMKKGEKRKQELLRIAYRMFITKGYENTSVDDIIKEAGIAKGTCYYYFKSKEEMLEEVIGSMIESEAEAAKGVLGADIPVPQKVLGIIGAFRPAEEEQNIGEMLHRPENVLMHDKMNHMLLDTITPLVSSVVEEGVQEGIFDCEDIPERVRMMLVLVIHLFNENDFTEKDVRVFVELIEKLFGAKPGTMGFVGKALKGE